MYCDDLPEYSVFNIARIRNPKLKEFIEADIYDITDVDLEAISLSPKQKRQVVVAQEEIVAVQYDKIREILNGLEYPLYFLDYETYSYVIPAQDRIKPYQQMIFQYSLHTISEAGAEPVHQEYLLREKTEPVEELVKHLQGNIAESGGTVIVWNEGFEKSRNKEIAAVLPDYADFLLSVNARIYDLMKPFSKGLYEHFAFKGRSSIKKVLPILCPELSYTDLEIQNGGSAVIEWHKAVNDKYSEEKKQATFTALLKYCEPDTRVMVRIWEVLMSEVSE